MTKVYSAVATFVNLEEDSHVYYYPDGILHESYDKAMKHLFRTAIPELLDEHGINFGLPDSFRKKIKELIEKNKDKDEQDSDYDEDEDDRYCWEFYFRNFDVDEVEFEDLFETGCDGFSVSYLITEYNLPKRQRKEDEEQESNKRQK